MHSPTPETLLKRLATDSIIFIGYLKEIKSHFKSQRSQIPLRFTIKTLKTFKSSDLIPLGKLRTNTFAWFCLLCCKTWLQHSGQLMKPLVGETIWMTETVWFNLTTFI